MGGGKTDGRTDGLTDDGRTDARRVHLLAVNKLENKSNGIV